MDDYIVHFIAGEPMAFAEVYKRYRNQVIAYCYRTTRCHETAEELAQDVFLKLYDARDKLDVQQGVKNYLMAIARTTVLGWFRKVHYDKKLKEEFLIRYEIAQSEESTERKIQASIELDNLKSIIAKLPAKRQKVFQLVRMEDKSYEETAHNLSISIDTVKYHLKKADKSLSIQRFSVDSLCQLVILLTSFFA